MASTLDQKIAKARAMGMPENIIQQKAAAYQQANQPLTAKVGKFAVNTAKSMVKPITDYAKSGMEMTPQQRMASMALGPLGILATPKGRKAATTTASFMVPFGKGANIATKALLPGAAVGGLSAYGEGQNVAQGAAMGALGSGALYGAGKAVQAVTGKLPKRIMNTVFKEPLKETKATIKGGKRLGEEVLKRGHKGMTEEKIYETAILNIEKAENQLQSKLSKSTRTIPIADIYTDVLPVIKKYQAAGNQTAANNLIDRLQRLTEYHGGDIPVSAANEIKRTLYEEARNGYGQLASENIEAVKALARSLKTHIASKVKGANEINKILSYEGKVADSMMDKLARGGRNNLMGLTNSILTGGGIATAAATGGLSLAPAAASMVLGSTPGKIGTARALNSANKVMGKISKIPGIQTGAGQITARLGQKTGEMVNPSVSQQGPQANAYGNNYPQQQSFHTSTIPQASNGGKISYTDYLAKYGGEISPESYARYQNDLNLTEPMPQGANDKVWIRNSQTGERRQVSRSELPQYIGGGQQQTQQNGIPTYDQFNQAIWNAFNNGNMSAVKNIQLLQKQFYPDGSNGATGGKQKPLTGTQINQVNLAKSGLRSLQRIDQVLGITRDASGNISPESNIDTSAVVKNALIPAKLGSREYDSATYAATEAILRARSGAAVPETEVKRYQYAFFPRLGDDQQTVKNKMNEVYYILSDMAGQQGQGISTEDLMQSFGY